jgi:hypothetical protein
VLPLPLSSLLPVGWKLPLPLSLLLSGDSLCHCCWLSWYSGYSCFHQCFFFLHVTSSAHSTDGEDQK